MRKEYRIKVTVRNNLILKAIEAQGFKSCAEFARYAGMKDTQVNALVCMREQPIGVNGEFSLAAKALMEALGAAPNDLWTDTQLYTRLRRNSGEVQKTADEFKALLADGIKPAQLEAPDAFIERLELERDVEKALANSRIGKREERVLRGKLWGEKTFEEIAQEEDVTRERIRQIEVKGLRKLRDPKVNRKLIDHLDDRGHEEWGGGLEAWES